MPFHIQKYRHRNIAIELTGVSQFTVTESYMDYIFAAVVSVGLLSFSIIALVAGIFY